MKAYIFPGQGAQFVGMGKVLYNTTGQAKEMFERANDILGLRITDIMFDGTDEDLKQTKVTQPAIFLRFGYDGHILHPSCEAISDAKERDPPWRGIVGYQISWKQDEQCNRDTECLYLHGREGKRREGTSQYATRRSFDRSRQRPR